MDSRDDPTVSVAVARFVAGALPGLVAATGSDAGDGACLASERNQFRGFNCWTKPIFCLGRLLEAAGAASVIGAGLPGVVCVVSELASGDWFSATSCAGLIGSSSSRRTTSTFAGDADGLSALAGTVAGVGSGRVVPGGGEAAALARDGDGAGGVGGDVEVADDLGTAATSGGWLVPGGDDAGGLVRKASGAGRFVATGCAEG